MQTYKLTVSYHSILNTQSMLVSLASAEHSQLSVIIMLFKF